MRLFRLLSNVGGVLDHFFTKGSLTVSFVVFVFKKAHLFPKSWCKQKDNQSAFENHLVITSRYSTWKLQRNFCVERISSSVTSILSTVALHHHQPLLHKARSSSQGTEDVVNIFFEAVAVVNRLAFQPNVSVKQTFFANKAKWGQGGWVTCLTHL